MDQLPLLPNARMVALRIVVCFAVFAATAVATNVQQCIDNSFENLSENVQLPPCINPPCTLKKGTNQNITINFTPENTITNIANHVILNIVGLPFPLQGVDGLPICDKIYLENGDVASCPLKAGMKYTYKDSFYVSNINPLITSNVHWMISGRDSANKQKTAVCFEVAVQFV